MALLWGGEDIISLAKEVIKIAEDKEFEPFVPKGGVMDGQQLAADAGEGASASGQAGKEQLSILSRADLEPRCDALESVARRRQQAGESDQEEERRRRRVKRRADVGLTKKSARLRPASTPIDQTKFTRPSTRKVSTSHVYSNHGIC